MTEAHFGATHTPITKSRDKAGTAQAHLGYIVERNRERDVTMVIGPDQKPEDWSPIYEGTLRVNGRVCEKIRFVFPLGIPIDARAEFIKTCVSDLVGGPDKLKQTKWCAALHMSGKDEHNPHAHMVISDRNIVTGRSLFKASSLTSTERIRESLENSTNRELLIHAPGSHVDRRSFKRRGSAQIPTRHVGPPRMRKAREAVEHNRTVGIANDLARREAELDSERRLIEKEQVELASLVAINAALDDVETPLSTSFGATAAAGIRAVYELASIAATARIVTSAHPQTTPEIFALALEPILEPIIEATPIRFNEVSNVAEFQRLSDLERSEEALIGFNEAELGPEQKRLDDHAAVAVKTEHLDDGRSVGGAAPSLTVEQGVKLARVRGVVIAVPRTRIKASVEATPVAVVIDTPAVVAQPDPVATKGAELKRAAYERAGPLEVKRPADEGTAAALEEARLNDLAAANKNNTEPTPPIPVVAVVTRLAEERGPQVVGPIEPIPIPTRIFVKQTPARASKPTRASMPAATNQRSFDPFDRSTTVREVLRELAEVRDLDDPKTRKYYDAANRTINDYVKTRADLLHEGHANIGFVRARDLPTVEEKLKKLGAATTLELYMRRLIAVASDATCSARMYVATVVQAVERAVDDLAAVVVKPDRAIEPIIKPPTKSDAEAREDQAFPPR